VNKKRIVFLTGTRADFGKMKSLIKITQFDNSFEIHIFATGMHMSRKYGKTVDEVVKSGFKNIYMYINHDEIDHMDRTLAKTIDGFSHYVAETKPDLIIVHGDRPEALAGAIVGSLNNILVAHIEGGEISGTIDELIRHAVSKMSHIHLVANDSAKKRLVQLGEKSNSIFVIGSPDLDLMKPGLLPDIQDVKSYYNISFTSYSILMFHPVTTEYSAIKKHIAEVVNAIIKSKLNYVIIYPNNDLGSNEILSEYERFKGENFRIFPSLRFEYFLTLLKDATFIIGNSSAGIREAPFYNVPTIDIGSRQNRRAICGGVVHAQYNSQDILSKIHNIKKSNNKYSSVNNSFGDGNSDKKFIQLLHSKFLWDISHQKELQELD
jgi:UDP-N-acetylglucosamine 2-epimerase (hydrolysing)